ncbi:unnamed protein product [Bursaphelenchus okinawaensis]|uniref:Uncharacterized protein n=1 Tax=Bursaphelenchus okinawaensis TaxID=465554 RepID=A0A811L783_9BILA|nr:unnamed protein product [Bursaphelenchus okinawaensis]CAG9119580.1 unnamed protein product [Bursaphelenchus okinawaensis]
MCFKVMAYPLTHSKSHNEVVNPSGIHIIDCFKRFATKSRSKKKLHNFDWVPKPEDERQTLSIDAKPKKYGSSVAVNQLKTDYSQATVNYLKFKARKADLMNQSCYGKLSTDDYDNMSDLVKVREVEVNVRRPRKAVSEVDGPSVEVGNTNMVYKNRRHRDDRKSCIEHVNNVSSLERPYDMNKSYTTLEGSSVVWNDELKPIRNDELRRSFGQSYGYSVNTGGSASTFSPPIVAEPHQPRTYLEAAYQPSDVVFGDGNGDGATFGEYDGDQTLQTESFHTAINSHSRDVSRHPSMNHHYQRDLYSVVQPTRRRLENIDEGNNLYTRDLKTTFTGYVDYERKYKDLLAKHDKEMEAKHQIMKQLDQMAKEKERESEEKERLAKKYEELESRYERLKADKASRLYDYVKHCSNPNTPITERLEEELENLTNSTTSISLSDRPPLPSSRSMNLTPSTRHNQSFQRRPTSLIATHSLLKKNYVPTPNSADRCKLPSKKDIQSRSTSTTPDSGALSVNGELGLEIGLKMEEVKKNMLFMGNVLDRLTKNVNNLLDDNSFNMSDFIDVALSVGMSLDTSKRVTAEEIHSFLELHSKQLWSFADQVDGLDLLLTSLAMRNCDKPCVIQ